MRVCILTTSFPAHKDDIRSPFILELCKALRQHDVGVDVIAPRYSHSSSEDVIDGIHIHRFSYFIPSSLQVLTEGGGIPSALKRSWLAKLQFPLFYLSFLMKALRHAKQCEVIHCQWSFSALVGLVLKIAYRKPLVMTERGASAHLAMGNWLMRYVLSFVAKRCDFVTANSIQQASLFVDLGVPRHKVATILNGIDTMRYRPLPKTTSRNALNLLQKNKIVLFVGWLIERKNVKSLIEAMKIITKKHNDAFCVLVGEGERRHSLEALVKKNKLEHVVSFVGSVPPAKIPLYMSAADVFVLPSLSEGKPNVVAEAMACGVPVVATNVAGT
ncbi:MAG: glycosyltransferase, partial [Nanoarchaeota archaeon]